MRPEMSSPVSNATMASAASRAVVRLLITAVATAALAGCAARVPPRLLSELGRAQALLQQGCYACLVDALEIYERLAMAPRPPADAALGAAHAAVLLVARAKELGLPSGERLGRAQAWIQKLPPAAAGVSPAAYLDALPLVNGEVSGFPPEERERLNRERRAAWPADGTLPAARVALSAMSETDLVAQYLAVAIDCEDARARKGVNPEEILLRHPYDLMRFRLALCGLANRRLDPLRAQDPRWVDTLFFEGRHEMTRFPTIDVGKAAELLSAAHDAFSESTAMTLALGNARNALEEYQPALALFDSILAIAPTHRDAMLGRLLSLSYLRQHYDATRTATQMIELGTYHMGDAYYWRAWNRYHVHDLPPAWTDIEQATKLMVHTAVYTLAGFIAYAQRELDIAIDRLAQAFKLDNTNCEAAWTEGMVHVDKEDWANASSRFTVSGSCFAADAVAARESMVTIQNSTSAEAVKARRLATAQRRAESSDHRRAQSAFNAASSYVRLARKADALTQLDIAAAHPLLKDKADALRVAVEKLP
jgi:tetratricopeptide (TPR) repeat protein